MSLISKFRSRRAIKNKLDEVARIFNYDYSVDTLPVSVNYNLSDTDCAIITDEGDILTRKSGTSTKPFSEVAPKVARLRATSEKVAYALLSPANSADLQLLHVRGTSTMLSMYALGSHTLVAISYLRDIHMDAAITRIDAALNSSNLIPELARLVVI